MAAVCTFIASAAEIQFFNGKKGRQTLNRSILHDLGADVKLFSERFGVAQVCSRYVRSQPKILIRVFRFLIRAIRGGEAGPYPVSVASIRR